MADIEKKIKLDFAAIGLDTISSELEKMGPLLNTSKDGKKLVDNLKAEILQLQKIGAEEGFELGGEAAAQFRKDYLAIISDFQKLRSIVAAPLDPELEKRRLELSTLIASGEDKRIALQKEIDKASDKIEIDESGTPQASVELKKSILESKKEMDGLLNSFGKTTASFETWNKSATKFQEALKAAGLEGVKNQKDIDNLSDEEKARLQAAMKERKLYWTLEQSGAQLQKKLLVDREAEKQLKIAIKKEAETKLELEKEEIILQQRKNEALEIERQIGEDIAEGDPTSQVAELGVEITKLSTTLKSQTLNAFQTYNKELIQSKKGQKEVKTEVDKTTNSFQQAAKNVFSYGIAFTALRRIYRETIRTITELDKALTEMSVVTTMNRQETQMLVGTFQNLAKETGFTTTEIAKLSTVYFRQGRSLKDVIELTTIAAKAARIAGIGATESANLLTAAVNGFGLAAKEAEAVSDKFAALAASSASSYQELAVGLSKFASQAKVAGLSLDFAMGLLAKGVETTREAPESIGTALKTILARMRELTDLGKTLEDGMDVSRVDTALRQIGVNLRDTNGQFRDMEDVLTEVGNKFSSLNKMQQASVAVALAGTRQQSRLLAIFQDFDRTLELVQTSEESAGATTAQHLKFMEGMEATLTNLRTSYQKFITTITESEVVIGIVRTLSASLDLVTNGLNSLGLSGKNAMIAMIGLGAGLKAYSVIQSVANANTATGVFLSKLLGVGQAKEAGGLLALNTIKLGNIHLNELESALISKNNALKVVQNTLSNQGISAALREKALAKQKILENEIKILQDKKAIIQDRISLTQRSLSQKLTLKEIILLKVRNINDGIRLFLKEKDIKLSAKSILLKIKNIFLDTISIVKSGILTGALVAQTMAQKGLNAAMNKNPIGAIILLVMGLVAVISILIKGFRDSEKGTASFSSGIAKGFKAIGDIFKSLFNALKGLFNLLKPFLLIWASVSLAPIIFAFGRILLVFKAITFVIRLLNVGIAALSAWIKKLFAGLKEKEGVQNFLKFLDRGKKAVENFIGTIRQVKKDFQDWEKSILDLNKTYEDLQKEIQKTIDKNIAENYELGQKNKTIAKLTKEYDELNSKAIKTDEDIEAIRELEQQVKDFLGETKAKEFLTSEGFDMVSALAEMDSQLAENRKIMLDNARNSATESLRLMRNDAQKFLDDPKNINLITSYLTGQIEARENQEALTGEQRRSLRIANKNLLEAFQGELTKATTDKQREEILQRMFIQAEDFLEVTDKLRRAIKSSGGDIQEDVLSFNKVLVSLGDDKNAIESLKETFPELAFLLDKFGTQITQTKFDELFKNLGFDTATFNRISKNLKDTGVSVEDFLTGVADEQQRLMKSGMGSSEAYAQAWGQASMSVGKNITNQTERAKIRIDLLNIAMKKTTLETAQEMDRLGSEVERLGKAQEDFAKGVLSYQDLLKFIEDFNLTDEQVEDFMLGRDLSESLREKQKLERQGFLDTIKLLEAQLSRMKDLDSEEAKAIKSQIARNRLLYDYGNELKRVTEAEYNYNAALEQQNRLSQLGIESDEMRLQVLQATLNFTTERFNESNRKLLKENETLQKALGDNFEDYFDIVNGVFIWNYNLLEQHGKETVSGLQKSYQEALDENLKYFKQLMDQSVGREKAIADEKKKVYEKYFADLDRLEEKRERKLNREQLVQQLTRLEGATDEKSRQKAKQLRSDLLKLDKDAAKKTQEEARRDLLAAIDNSLEELTKAWQDIYTNLISSGGLAGLEFLEALEAGGLIEPGAAEAARGAMQDKPGFKKGGIVDFTGPAMVHGTKTKPEAFLNSEQTEMFGNLRDSLSKISFEPSSISETVSIGNISISTQSMNNNQDFKKAGQVLADAFNSAINRRGISVNTKR